MGYIMPGVMGYYVGNGDTLYSVFYIAQHIEKILSFNFKDYWTVNAFYPYKDYMLLNDHQLGNALLAIPVYIISKDYILSYNIVLFLSFWLSGFFAYIFINYLTKNKIAGIFGGVIFAYNSYRMGHLSHISLLAAQWIPLIFLYMHKLKEKQNWKNLCLLGLFYIFQAISSLYYFLMINIFLIILFIWFLLITNKDNIKKLFIWFTSAAAFILLILSPYIYKLFALQHLYKFKRDSNDILTYSSDIIHFFSVDSHNFLYRKIFFDSSSFSLEGMLFPGFIPLITVVFFLIGIFLGAQKEPEEKTLKDSLFRKINLFSLLISILLFVIYFIAIKIRFGADFNFLGFMLNFRIVIGGLLIYSLLFYFLTLKSVLNFIKINWRTDYFPYLIILFAALFLSMGPIIMICKLKISAGPYLLISKLPGFSGIRAVARFYVFFSMAFAVIAAFGIKEIININRRYLWVCIILLPIIILEHFSYVIHHSPIDKKEQLPSVYKWLGEQKEKAIILELPLMYHDSNEGRYLYYSIYHKRTLINGYGGWTPWLFKKLNELYYNDIPRFIEVIKKLNVNYIIVHLDYPKIMGQIENEHLYKIKENFRQIKDYGNILVFEADNPSLELDVYDKKGMIKIIESLKSGQNNK